jgi:hypothetical protein
LLPVAVSGYDGAMLLAIVLLAAPAEPPRVLHMGARVHLGYGFYEQLQFSDREVSGPLLDLGFHLGARFGGDFFAGGSAELITFVANSGTRKKNGEALDVPLLAFGGMFGPIVGWAPLDSRVSADVFAGFFGGGAVGVWGGFGLAFVPSVNVALLHRGNHTLSLTGRLLWAPSVVSGDREGDDTSYASFHLGAGWSFN